jgi:hypothetical protein
MYCPIGDIGGIGGIVDGRGDPIGACVWSGSEFGEETSVEGGNVAAIDGAGDGAGPGAGRGADTGAVAAPGAGVGVAAGGGAGI